MLGVFDEDGNPVESDGEDDPDFDPTEDENELKRKYSDDEDESVPPKKTRLEKRDSNFVESALSQYMNKNPVINPSNPASKQTRFTCNLCDKSYTRNSNLNAHKRQKHANLSQNGNITVNSTVNLTTSSANQTKPFTTRKKVECSDPRHESKCSSTPH